MNINLHLLHELKGAVDGWVCSGTVSMLQLNTLPHAEKNKTASFYLSICSLQKARHQKQLSDVLRWLYVPSHRLNEHMPHLNASRMEIEIQTPGP